MSNSVNGVDSAVEEPSITSDNNTHKSAFDIHAVERHFRESLDHEDEDVHLLRFIDAYEELSRFIGCLGRIFLFVQKDIDEKTTALTALHNKEPEKFNSIRGILRESNGKPKAKGVFEIITLHRALEFIMDFMMAVAEAENSDSVSHLCRVSYDRTLAKHHAWLIRKAVHAASFTLPTRINLIIFIHGSYPDEGEQLIKQTIEKVVQQGDAVHKRIHGILKQHVQQ